jgi:hypothetical protein
MQHRPLRRPLALLALLLGSLLGRAGRAAEVPLSADQMVQLSRQVVVAVVEGQQARWNEQHTLIVTDYFLRVESRLRGKIEDRVKLTMPGGTLDGETHHTSLTVPLRKGARYLLFCRDLGQYQMAPITGTWQGVFREALRPDGARVVESAEGAVQLRISGKAVSFLDFVEAVRELVRKTPADSTSAAAAAIPGWSATPKNLPAKVYSPLAQPPDERFLHVPEALAMPENLPPHRPDGPGTAGLLMAEGAAAGTAGSLDILTGRYFYLHRPTAPVVFNPLQDSLTPWSPEDKAMMAYWNVYAKGLFGTYLYPTGTWAWADGINDIAGFPDDVEMRSQFGDTWGANVLGVAYSRWLGENGRIIETDIALNPHFTWTTDEALASTGSSEAWSFRQTLLHELGHAWGLQHPWETQRVWWDSVMNYAPKATRLPRLFSDDTAAVRAAYPGTRLHDGLLSAYRTDFGSDNHAVYKASEPKAAFVPAGDSFQMNQAITLENVGTDDLVDPVVDVYLTPRRLSFDGAILLATVQYTRVIHPYPSNPVQALDLGALTIPRSAPGGRYAVAFFLRDDTDAYQTNNSAWTNTFIEVKGDLNPNCNPDAKTLCVDDQPGDERFKVTVDYSTGAGGGASGSATAIPLSSLGVFRGGLFWFFSADNPEMLVKVINGCPVNGHYWVFASAGTNVGLSMTVTDTRNDRQKSYRNDDGTSAAPIQDTQAFACSVP